ncbi:DJ-1 family protein [Candidatus Magnetobacterium bavaricum]|uniref:DJ-1 family protein n=1 Tax=Candidatus Magnetobacterium bavaricum TaxID=29290 RepID=A0A0F3GM78_9BACT|nr:DJ-1 family protein [Candidatus Magnetobacterium bavaricum]
MERVLLLLAEGFEELEAVTIVDVLRRAEIDIVMAGLGDGVMTSARRIKIVPDMQLEDVDIDQFDMVVLPGGQPGTDNLAKDERVIRIIRTMNEKGKYTAAICAAPYVLSEAGVLADKRATSYPTFQERLKAAEVVKDQRVVRDGTVITSCGPGTAIDFALALVELFRGKQKAQTIRQAMLFA